MFIFDYEYARKLGLTPHHRKSRMVQETDKLQISAIRNTRCLIDDNDDDDDDDDDDERPT